MRTDVGNSAGFSRRGVVTLGTAVTAAVASGTGAISQGLSPEVAALKRAFEAAHAAYLVANKQYDVAETRWYALKPKLPTELREPFGPIIDPITHKRPWSAAGLRLMAEKRRAAARSSADHELLREDAARAEALIPVAEAYEAAVDHAKRASNVEALEALTGSWGALDEIAERIMEVAPRTAADFAFKVEILRDWIWPDLQHPPVLESDPKYASAARVLEDALALIGGGEQLPPAANKWRGSDHREGRKQHLPPAASFGSKWVGTARGIASANIPSLSSGGPAVIEIHGFTTEGDCTPFRAKRVSAGVTAWDGRAAWTDANGQKWERLIDGGEVWFMQFGAVKNPTGHPYYSSGMDSYPAFQAAQAFLYAKGNRDTVTENGCATLRIDPYYFYSSERWTLKGGTFNIIGSMTGQNSGASRPRLMFRYNKGGIVGEFYNTVGGGQTEPAGVDSGGTLLKGLHIYSLHFDVPIKDQTRATDGVVFYTRFEMEDCVIEGFGRDGLVVYANTPNEGNANCWSIQRCTFRFNGRHGAYLIGSDVNASGMHDCDFWGNGAWGILDESFLGFAGINIHTGENGIGPHTQRYCMVNHNGTGYAVRKGQEAAASTQVPGTGSAWIPNVGTPFGTPNWVSGTTYQSGGGYCSTNVNNRTALIGLYGEGGMAPNQTAGRTRIITGTNEPGFSPGSTGTLLDQYGYWRNGLLAESYDEANATWLKSHLGTMGGGNEMLGWEHPGWTAGGPQFLKSGRRVEVRHGGQTAFRLLDGGGGDPAGLGTDRLLLGSPTNGFGHITWRPGDPTGEAFEKDTLILLGNRNQGQAHFIICLAAGTYGSSGKFVKFGRSSLDIFVPYSPGPIRANSMGSETSITMTGVQPDHLLSVGFDVSHQTPCIPFVRYLAANTVGVRMWNPTGSSQSPPAGNLTIKASY